jgi:hypothetical protein
MITMDNLLLRFNFWIIEIKIMDDREPPKALVETWLHLLTQNDDKELKEIGKDKLLGAFEDMQAVATYIKKQNIKV